MGNLISGRVQRGVGWRVGGQREQDEERDQRQHQPQKHVQGAVAGGRENNANGLHGGFAPAPRRAAGADGESQSSLYYPWRGGESQAKEERGNLAVDPRRGSHLFGGESIFEIPVLVGRGFNPANEALQDRRGITVFGKTPRNE